MNQFNRTPIFTQSNQINDSNDLSLKKKLKSFLNQQPEYGNDLTQQQFNQNYAFKNRNRLFTVGKYSENNG